MSFDVIHSMREKVLTSIHRHRHSVYLLCTYKLMRKKTIYDFLLSFASETSSHMMRTAFVSCGGTFSANFMFKIHLKHSYVNQIIILNITKCEYIYRMKNGIFPASQPYPRQFIRCSDKINAHCND